MMRFLVFFSLALALHAIADEDINQIVIFEKSGETKKVRISFINDSGKKQSNIKVSVDCGCISILDWSRELDSNLEGYIDFNFSSINDERRSNQFFVSGDGFKKKIDLITYFIGHKISLYGNTVIDVKSLPRGEVTRAVVALSSESEILSRCGIIGGGKGVKTSFGYVEPIVGADGCFRRVISITVNRETALSAGNNSINVYEASTGDVKVEVN